MWSGGLRLKQSTESGPAADGHRWVDKEMVRHHRPDEEDQRRRNQKICHTSPEHPNFLEKLGLNSGSCWSQKDAANTYIVNWVEALAIAVVLPGLLYGGVEQQGDYGEKGKTPTDDDNSRPPESREHENDVIAWSPVSLK